MWLGFITDASMDKLMFGAKLDLCDFAGENKFFFIVANELPRISI